jgi:hypothetical protein
VIEEGPIREYLEIVLALNAAVGKRTGIEPLLSRDTYSYGIPVPSWDWDEIGRRIEETRTAIDSLPTKRAAYLQGFLDAFALMVREGQGESIPYSERVSTYLQVPSERVPASAIQSLESELQDLCIAAGYPDDLSIAIPRWRDDQTITGEALIEQAKSLVLQSREAMQRRIMPLPDEHQVSVTLLKDFPYYAYSAYARDYQGQVRLSDDISWELAALKHAICHEAFPGHQAFAAITEQRFREGIFPVEGTVYFGNTPISPIFEGVAECGAELLGMVDTIDDRIFNVYNRLCFAVSTNVAFDCNADGMEEPAAVTKLMDALHVPQAWAVQRYHYVLNPLWCTSFPHYWYGREFIRDSHSKMKGHLPAFFEMVFTEPHTVRTLRDSIESYLDQAADEPNEDATKEPANPQHQSIEGP